jgi:hypothetical protein
LEDLKKQYIPRVKNTNDSLHKAKFRSRNTMGSSNVLNDDIDGCLKLNFDVSFELRFRYIFINTKNNTFGTMMDLMNYL